MGDCERGEDELAGPAKLRASLHEAGRWFASSEFTSRIALWAALDFVVQSLVAAHAPEDMQRQDSFPPRISRTVRARAVPSGRT
jgi:hypothetical protein